MSDLILDVHGLVKRFGGLTAVRWVDLDIPRKSIASTSASRFELIP